MAKTRTVIFFFYSIIMDRFYNLYKNLCRCGRDHMVVGFTTTYAISAYHN
jgi:hypothetical protein